MAVSGNFRKNLRRELDYQGILVKELSVKTGIPIATLDCYLGTRATVPSVEAAIKIAKALQVSVEYLVIGDNSETKKTPPKHDRETQELIKVMEQLNPAQRKSILYLLQAFKVKASNKK